MNFEFNKDAYEEYRHRVTSKSSKNTDYDINCLMGRVLNHSAVFASCAKGNFFGIGIDISSTLESIIGAIMSVEMITDEWIEVSKLFTYDEGELDDLLVSASKNNPFSKGIQLIRTHFIIKEERKKNNG